MAQEWRFFGRTLKDIHSHLGAPCHATLLNGKTYSGYLYNVDPETYTLLILQLQEQPENETQTQSHAGHEVDTKQDTVKRGLSMTAVRRHATKEFGIDTSTSESLTLQEMDSMVRVLSNIGSPEQVKARKDRLVASLQSHVSVAMANYYPPQQQQQQQQYPPPQHPPFQYGGQPQPQYQPLQQQQQWGLQPDAQQQQYFAPQGQPMTGVMPPSYDGVVNPETGLPAKFNPKPKYNDLWAFLLFLVQLAAFVVLSYFAISRVKDSGNGGAGGGATLGLFSTSGLITLFISIAVGAIFAVVYFFITQAFPRAVIKVTFALSILLYFVVAAYYLYRRFYLVGIISLIFAVLYASMWFFWRSRIEFASVMLQTVTSVSKTYPATFALAFLGLFVQIAYSIYFMTVIAGTYDLYYDTTTRTTPTKLKVLIVFCFFSFYWTSQVVANIVHTTVCGVYATYYFLAGSPQGMTKSPTLESLKRACTTSIGSICFGSLIIAIIQTLKAVANMARSETDGIMAFVLCLIECLLACIQGIAEYVNKYAFAQVAIYGKPYIQAAKDTWTILKDRGIEQLINDNLIGNVWGMAAILSGCLSGLASYLYLRFADPVFNQAGEFTVIFVIMGFVMGLQICFTVGTVVDSGVVTTFVCLAEDPAALARTKPELFEKIRQTWPEVVQGVRY
ncbi:putative choline transporter, neither null mutation nor overexpression affects choline transport [Mortierella sp. GBA30]|nr:putative choline transporter, neither null mutation nor overexpression affects choline transport [Mortierella sp. GBA30]